MALIFLAVALVAALLGFTEIAVATASVARVIFVIFMALFLIALVMSIFKKPSTRRM